MSASTTQLPHRLLDARDVWHISVARYHQMVAAGVITVNDRVELLEGVLVNKMSKGPEHSLSVVLLNETIRTVLPPGWYVSIEQPVSMDDSEPEPDAAVIRGKPRDHTTRHPQAAEVAIVIEVADSSLRRDREDKRRIYARNGIAVYWIVNVADRVIDVFTNPSGPVLTPDYATTTTYHIGDAVPVVLDGVTIATVAAADLLP